MVHSAESRAVFEDGRSDWNIWLLLGDKYAGTGTLGVMFDVGKGEKRPGMGLLSL